MPQFTFEQIQALSKKQGSDLVIDRNSLSQFTFEQVWALSKKHGGVVIVTIPIVTIDTYTYDGTEQGPTITDLDTAHVNVVNAKNIDAGTYTLTLSLKNPNKQVWSDSTVEDKTYEYTIDKATVTVPTVTDTSLTYNGSEQSPTIIGFDADIMSKTGDSGTNAGSYSIVFSLVDSDNYEWGAGETTVPWAINKATVTVPTVTNTNLTYNGGSQGPTIVGFDSALMTKTGDTATNAGSYTLTFALIDSNNYAWGAGSTSVSWAIAKANQTVTVSTNSVSLSSSQTYADVTITHSGGGTFSVSSSNTGVATVANTSGNTYRITGVANGSATITASMSATSNYNAASATISVSVMMVKIVTWANGTDAEIVAMVAAADRGEINLSDYWHVGDERTVSLSAMSATGVQESHVAQTVTFVLMQAGLYDLTSAVASGRTKCSFIVGMKNCLLEIGKMHYPNTEYTSWKDSKRRTWCNNVFYNAIPSSIRGIFKQFKTLTATKYNQGSTRTTEYTNDYFALPAEKEVHGARTYSLEVEANALTQFTYYATTANRIKKLGNDGSASKWWERSPVYNIANAFSMVYDGGGAGGGGSNGIEDKLYGLSPFGCI